MILKSFRKKKKEYIYRNKQRETTSPLPPFLFLFSTIDMRNIGSGEKKRGKRRKKTRTLLESHVILFLWYLINGWCIPIRRPAAAAAVAITGKQKRNRNRKDKIGKVLLRIKQMAVQHKVAIPVNCELPPSRPPARLYRTQRRRAETYLCFFN